jgi:hypothetical protein
LWERSTYEKFAAPIYFRSYTPVPYVSDQIQGLYFAGIFSPPSRTGRIVDSSVVTGTQGAEIVKRDSGGTGDKQTVVYLKHENGY